MECGFDSLEVIAFTHPHADHIGGCRDAMEVFHCGKLIDPGIDHPSPVYEELLEYTWNRAATMRFQHWNELGAFSRGNRGGGLAGTWCRLTQ